jgi:hypothetical protein
MKIIEPQTIWGFNAPPRLQRAPSPHRVTQLRFHLRTVRCSSARFDSHPALHFLLFPNKRDLGRERDRQGRLQRASRSGVLAVVVVEVEEGSQATADASTSESLVALEAATLPSLCASPMPSPWSPPLLLRRSLNPSAISILLCEPNFGIKSVIRYSLPLIGKLPALWSQAPESILNWVWPWVRGF